MRPGIFIGSSSEGLEIAKALQYHLSEFADATIWTDNVFQLSKSNMENLLKILDNSNYGVFILSSDDFISSRGTNEYAPRDNVIFELGLFAGRLGMHKTYVVHHKNEKPKIPTDIMGITLASYHEYSSGNLIAALSSASMLIKQSITENESVKKIPSETIKIDMTWDCMCSAITSIGKNIRRSPHDGGFMPDLIIGVSRGGIIIADLLSRYLGGHIPVQCLWADRYKKYPHTVISPPHNIVNKHFKNLLSINGFKNILIVDDISRPGDNGSTISLAREFIQNMNLELTIKTLVLTIHDNAQEIPDYFAFKHNNTKYKMPFSVLG